MDEQIALDVRQTRFPFNSITTTLFLLIVFLYPIILVFRLLGAQLAGNLGELFSSQYTGGSTTIVLLYIENFVFVNILAIFTFLGRPSIRIHQMKMEPLQLCRPDLANEILGWNEMAPFRGKVVLLRIPTDRPEVFAFGTWRHKYIAISDGATVLWKEPKLFRAVLLHEIGHLINGDVWKASLALEYSKWMFVYQLYLLVSLILPALFNRFDKVSYGAIGLINGVYYMALAFFVLIAVRYLFRMRELGADHFAALKLSDKQVLQHALGRFATANWSANTSQPLSFLSEGVQNPFTQIMGFHPSIRMRLAVLQDPRAMIREILGLSMVAGIFVGVVISPYWGDNVLSTLFTVVVFVGIIIFFVMLVDLASEGRPQLGAYLLRSIMVFCSSVAFGLIITGMPDTWTKPSFVGSSWVLATAGELRFELGLSLDYLLFILIVLPVILFAFTFSGFLLSDAIRHLARNRPSYGFQIAMAWLAELPPILLVCWLFQQWWQGVDVPLKTTGWLLGLCLLWTAVVVFSSMLTGKGTIRGLRDR